MWGKYADKPYNQAMLCGEVSKPEQRAVTLLGSLLSEDYFRQYLQDGRLPVIGQLTGNEYIIRHKDRTQQVNAMGEVIASFCMHSSCEDSLPPTDDVISLFLIIQGHEDRFLNVANRMMQERWDDFDSWVSEDVFQGVLDCDKPHLSKLEQIRRHVDRQLDEAIDFPVLEPVPIEQHVNHDPVALLEAAFFNRTDENEVDERVLPADARQQRLSYETVISSAIGYDLDNNDMVPSVTIDDEGHYITHGIGSAIYTIDHLNSTLPLVYYNTPRGLVAVVLKSWPSGREFDNACIFFLLSTWSEMRLPGTEQETANRLTKVLMSSQSYKELVNPGIDIGATNCWRGRKVLIDDRLEHVVISLPDAANLGSIVVGADGNAGIVVMEPNNIVVEYLFDGRLVPMSCESAIEMMYGAFPDRCNALEYDVDRYQHQMVAMFRRNSIDPNVIVDSSNPECWWDLDSCDDSDDFLDF